MFWRDNLGYTGIIFTFLVIVFIIFRIFIVKLFYTFRDRKIILSDEKLEKITSDSKEVLFIRDINKLAVVVTKEKNIREVRVFSVGRTTVLDGYEDLKGFASNIIEVCDGKPVKKIYEPLSFDSPIFYPILGIIIGSLSLFFIKEISLLNFYQNLIWLKYGVALYVFAMGLFFFIDNPIARRYGKKSLKTDLIWGILFVISAISVAIL
ncbi:MAG: hypothetical protein WC536_00280 [Patescibacteria group bacterium]